MRDRLARQGPDQVFAGTAQSGAAVARDWLALPVGLTVLLGAWAVAADRIGRSYLLPTPASVLRSLIDNRALIAWHTRVTAAEIVLGFAVGFALALVMGYIISRSRALERLLTPYIVASQAIPIVAVAPLLVYWFSPGMPVKVTAAALIVFFPMLVNTVVGLRNINPAYLELMRSLSANSRQTLIKLEIPAALPVLLGGVRVGVTLSVIGAVVGEFLGSDRGLGSLVQVTNGQFNDALMFAALVVLVALALSLYSLAAAIERVLLARR
jgi:NitT/TauT family transport system permease protein